MDDEDKKRFVPQIDITHLLDVGEGNNSLIKKRDNATILEKKGLGHKHRMYEIAGLAHIDAGLVSRPDHVPQALDLGGVMAALVDRLDVWVDHGQPPAPTKSNLREFASTRSAGVNANSAVTLPEIACPLGFYHIFPEVLGDTLRGSQETGFAVFDGENLEPLDGRGQLVDMNGNRTRDKRETVAQAWTRSGLLKPGEKLTQKKYVACVTEAATKIAKEGLLPARVVNYYVKKAAATAIEPAVR
jgi:hypothetical protein